MQSKPLLKHEIEDRKFNGQIQSSVAKTSVRNLPRKTAVITSNGLSNPGWCCLKY